MLTGYVERGQHLLDSVTLEMGAKKLGSPRDAERDKVLDDVLGWKVPLELKLPAAHPPLKLSMQPATLANLPGLLIGMLNTSPSILITPYLVYQEFMY